MRKVLPPTLFLIGVGLMFGLHWLWPIARWLSFPANVLGLLPLIGGLGLALQGSRKFDGVGTNIKTFAEPDKFVTDGIFAFSRNPMYLGMVGALLGTAILLGTLAPLLIALLFFLVTDRWYIAFEEEMMAKKFGIRYRTYQTQVRRWL